MVIAGYRTIGLSEVVALGGWLVGFGVVASAWLECWG